MMLPNTLGNVTLAPKRKTWHRVTAPLGEGLVANEFLDFVSLGIVRP